MRNFMFLAGVFFISMIAHGDTIPLDVLFGNPEKTAVRIAPNGSCISYLKPDSCGRLQVWIATLDGQEEQVTHNQHRSITRYLWSYDNEHILYLQDADGNENWNLYQTNIRTSLTQNLTPFDMVQARILYYDPYHPDSIVVGLNCESKQQHDPYIINLKTHEIKLLEKSPSNASDLIINHNLELAGALVLLDDGSHQLLFKQQGAWKELASCGHEDNLSPLFFSRDHHYLYALDSTQGNSIQLVQFDLWQDGKLEIIASDPMYDACSVWCELNNYKIQAVNFTKQRNEWMVLDDTLKHDFENIQQLHKGDFTIVSRTNQDDLWVVAFNQDIGPVAYFLYNRITCKATFLFYNRPQLLQYTLAEMHPIAFQARDGLDLQGYMTYPVHHGVEKIPLVVYVHGGPWLRDCWGYDPVVQWLASRGYAVLQINFRGSTGYGKAFLNAGNKQWGKKMLDDLVDGAAWACQTGLIDEKRVAIFGGSYGGYAALCGATFTQGVFKCAVDICGRSNLFSRFYAIPEYWKLYIALQKHRIGDPETEFELLKSASPFFYADQITIPVFIAHGTQDARINSQESEKLVHILQKNNVACEYLTLPDEGHHFIKAQNRLLCFGAIEKFLEKYL